MCTLYPRNKYKIRDMLNIVNKKSLIFCHKVFGFHFEPQVTKCCFSRPNFYASCVAQYLWAAGLYPIFFYQNPFCKIKECVQVS